MIDFGLCVTIFWMPRFRRLEFWTARTCMGARFHIGFRAWFVQAELSIGRIKS